MTNDSDGHTPTETARVDPAEGAEHADHDEEDVYASDVEGRQYRGTSYLPLPYDDLPESSEEEDRPDTGRGGRFRDIDLPRVPKVSHVVGPSAIMLGASLGSGETLFWPVLVAQSGWALYWAFWVGVVTQFFINTELQRWTLATGESIFRSFARVSSGWPAALLLGGFLSLGWPGWAASAAQVGATTVGVGGAFGLDGWQLLAVVLMVLIWASYQVAPVMYNVVEGAQFVLVLLSILGALALVVVAGSLGQFANLPAGALSVGTLPPRRDLAVFLGGLAFAGAGGYLNLSQSLWTREKGYGMGKFQGRLKNPLIDDDDPEPVHENGFSFEPTRENLLRWRGWWRVVQLEHLLTFVLGLLVVATALMTVAAEYAPGTTANGLTMWLDVIMPALPVGKLLVPFVLFVALFTTEYAIVESFVRNSADVVYELYGRRAGWSFSLIFWVLLTGFTLWGILIVTVFAAEFPTGGGPFALLVIGAALSGVMMWPYSALTLVINTARLPEHLQPGWPRVVAMWWATGFFGYFSVLLVGETLAADLGVAAFRTDPAVLGSAPGGLLLWVVFLLAQGYTVYRSVDAKLDERGTVDGADIVRGWLS
jgi:hypothetical protein